MKYLIILTDLENTQYVVEQRSNRAEATAQFEFFRANATTPGTLVKSLNLSSIELVRMQPVATYFRSSQLCKLERIAAWQIESDAVNYRRERVNSLN